MAGTGAAALMTAGSPAALMTAGSQAALMAAGMTAGSGGATFITSQGGPTGMCHFSNSLLKFVAIIIENHLTLFYHPYGGRKNIYLILYYKVYLPKSISDF